jgi:hypothetical protein
VQGGRDAVGSLGSGVRCGVGAKAEGKRGVVHVCHGGVRLGKAKRLTNVANRIRPSFNGKLESNRTDSPMFMLLSSTRNFLLGGGC